MPKAAILASGCAKASMATSWHEPHPAIRTFSSDVDVTVPPEVMNESLYLVIINKLQVIGRSSVVKAVQTFAQWFAIIHGKR